MRKEKKKMQSCGHYEGEGLGGGLPRLLGIGEQESPSKRGHFSGDFNVKSRQPFEGKLPKQREQLCDRGPARRPEGQ